MARPHRIQFAGACYHVMNRGAQRRAIFGDDRDRSTFLDLLADASGRFSLDVFAYCLMGNHYHLYLRTNEPNLGRAMQHLDGVYTQRTNKRYGVDGPLFRGRYKSILVESERYSAGLARYIHRNPVEAGLVDRPGEYRWSSYVSLLEPQRRPAWLRGHLVLPEFASGAELAAYTECALPDSPVDAFYAQQRLKPILGSPLFAEQARGHANQTTE